MPLLAEHVPEDGRERVLLPIVPESHLGRALDQEVLGLADGRDPRQVALDVGRENGNSSRREALREDLQRHRLARAGGPGDEAVPVGEAQLQIFGLGALADEDFAVLDH
jgi:hypothetical protein